MNRNRKFSLLISCLLVMGLLLAGCSSSRTVAGGEKSKSGTIVFADAEWESIQIHNRIAGYILTHGYGYQVNYLAGETLPLFKALRRGDIDVMMEVWTSDYPQLWKQMTKSGQIKALGNNYVGLQGWFVPAYMVEGDKERGIEPQIPAFKSVQDLPAYQQYFKLSAASSKGIILNAPQGWPAATINQKKYETYRLAKTYSLLPTDSEKNLAATLDKAYQRGESWLGYAREPGLITAGHKLYLLREEPYDEEVWKRSQACAYPECNVMIATHAGMNQKAPEILDFLQKYKSTREQNQEMLLYLEKFEGNREKAAQEWLLNNPYVWSQWVPEEVANKVWADLNPPIAPKQTFWSKFLRK